MSVSEIQVRPATVELSRLVKRFGRDSLAVDSIDLHIESGELVTLLGPSGCGKTTTLRMIAGLERATSGKVMLDDEDVTRLPAYLRDVTMVFQSYALFPHMNVFENVAYGLRVARKSQAEISAGVDAALRMVGLQELSARPVTALSGGQQQRVALARALAIRPRVLLFDEPLSNLDAKLRKRVREDIRELQQRLGITSVYVTHDQEEALAISDRIVVINHGRIEQVGDPIELYTRPKTRFVADFIGAANFLPARFDGSNVVTGGHAFSHVHDGPSGDYTLVIRPEAVRLADQGLHARVVSSAYLGPVNEYVFATESGEIFASLSGEGEQLLERGAEVHLQFKPAGVHLLSE